jgi:hypothetical protein
VLGKNPEHFGPFRRVNNRRLRGTHLTLRAVTQTLTATLDRDSVTGSLDRNSSNGIVLISRVYFILNNYLRNRRKPAWLESLPRSAMNFCDGTCGIRQAYVVRRAKAIHSPTLGRELQELR